MGATLGSGGIARAVKINTGEAVSTLSTLYVGLLSTFPADAHKLSLATLSSSEFAISADFYTARKAVTMGTFSSLSDGTGYKDSAAPTLTWANTSGSTKNVAGFFITDASSGTSGSVLWVGTPDGGTSTITTGNSAQLTAGDLRLGVK